MFELPLANPTEPAHPQQKGTVEPTTACRSFVLDAIRGVAILGILLANLPSLGAPSLYESLGSAIEMSGVDLWVDTLTSVFVTGKFRSLLAILFGVGLFLQYRKRSLVPGNWPGGYLKRKFYLALIGLIHGFLIWFGDILFIYSVAAFCTCFIVTASERVRKTLFGVFIALAVVTGLGLLAFIWFAEGLGDDLGSNWGGEYFTLEFEQRVFGEGSWWEQLGARSLYFAAMASSAFVFLVWLLPLFMVGTDFARKGFPYDRERYAPFLRQLAWFGFGVGIPLNLLCLLSLSAMPPLVGQLLAEFFGGPVLSMGYLALLVALLDRPSLQPLFRPIANVGRCALTCYLMQSVLGSIVFYSWGLGWFGRLDRLELLGVAPLIWLANVLFATLWLRRYKMGPVEWAWRSLTEGRVLSNLKSKAPQLDAQ